MYMPLWGHTGFLLPVKHTWSAIFNGLNGYKVLFVHAHANMSVCMYFLYTMIVILRQFNIRFSFGAGSDRKAMLRYASYKYC